MIDVPAASVELAFAEAIIDCALLRVRHVAARGCGGDCSVDALLVYAQTVFEHWSERQIGADDLATAVMVLRSMGDVA